MKVGVVIPAYNVGDRLQEVLSQVSTHVSTSHIYVVDDGSTDVTAEVALKRGVCLFRHASNRGKGEALRNGFRLALTDGCEGVITLDGDGQHDPSLIPCFIQTMKATKSDVVLGVRRFKLGAMPLDRIFSNLVSSWIVSALVQQRVRDSQCGYRLYGAHVLRGISFVSSHYEVETELLMRILWKDWNVSYYSIPLIYESNTSHIHRFVDVLRFCRTVLHLVKKNKRGDVRD